MRELRPPGFVFRNRELHCEQAPLDALAKRYGTPLYVYSSDSISERFGEYAKAFARQSHSICYSVKANSNLSLLRMLARLGAGFDIVSGGELERVRRAASKSAGRVVFSGAGKTAHEIDAALKAGILIFNVESESELRLLAARAEAMRARARIALRVNPDVFAETHPYITTGMREHKFGVPIADAVRLYSLAWDFKYLDVAGVSVHIGSQITDIAPFGAAMQRVADLVRRLRADGHNIRYVDAGGGLGIDYQQGDKGEFANRLKSYATAIAKALHGLDIHLLLEPGRSIVAPAGLLLSRVIHVKRNGKKHFVIVDAAMNDLIRPSLYGAYHQIVPVAGERDAKTRMYDIVGPVCESGDFFARDREMPEVHEGELVALLDAGAYGMSLSSNYNSRPRPAEVMVYGKRAKLIRKRETYEDLVRHELL